MIFGRVKPIDAILETAERKSLHRTLGWFQLTLFGIGCVIGTGIFVLTAAGAQKAGPGLMLAFLIALLVGVWVWARFAWGERAALYAAAAHVRFETGLHACGEAAVQLGRLVQAHWQPSPAAAPAAAVE